MIDKKDNYLCYTLLALFKPKIKTLPKVSTGNSAF